MSLTLLLAAALGLPLAALGLVVGWVADRLTAATGPRIAVWTAALWAPVLLAPAAWDLPPGFPMHAIAPQAVERIQTTVDRDGNVGRVNFTIRPPSAQPR